MKFLALVGQGALFAVRSGFEMAHSKKLSFECNGLSLAVLSSHIHRVHNTTYLSVIIAYEQITGPAKLSIKFDGKVVATPAVDEARMAGRISRVVKGHLIGWISKLGKTAIDGDYYVEIDGKRINGALQVEPRKEFRFVSNARAMDGFSLALPSWCYDGKEHLFSLKSVNSQHDVHRFLWRHEIKCQIEVNSGGIISGWCFDERNRSQALQIVLLVDGKVFSEMTCFRRDDVTDVFSCGPSGFSFNVIQHARSIAIAPKYCPDWSFAGPFFMENAKSQVDSIWTAIREVRIADHLAGRITDQSVVASFRNTLSSVRQNNYSEFRKFVKTDFPEINKTVIIIPVYDGYEEVKLCLDSVMKSTPRSVEIIAIDDCGPDPRISSYLRDLEAAQKITLLVNEQNLGFPRSVNRGLEERRERSVVLLNADTIVPARWLERLTAAAQSKPYVASVTPLSNNATILSYPIMNCENPLNPETQLSEIDGIAARANSSLTVEIPVGVGFCMYMTASAIEEVGHLSEEWGRGYGEEVDWCMRARDLGYVHLAATDVFIGHEGSVSFGADTRKKLVAQNGLLLGSKYPDYLRHVIDFVREDPLRLARTAIDLMRIDAVGLPVRVHVTHNFSGGTQVHVRESIARRRGEELGCLLRPYKAADEWGQAVDAVATLRIPDLNIRIYLKEQEMVDFLKRVMANSNLPFILHSSLGWNETVLGRILQYFEYESVIHDYAWFCPRIQTFHDRTFCGIPNVEKCVQCVRTGNIPQDNEALSTREGLLGYVSRHHAILRNAQRISAPSETARSMTLRRFPDLSIEVQPHHEADSSYQIRGIDPRATIITIGFLGAIGVQKGFDVLRAISREVHERSLPIQLVIIGYTSDDNLLRSENPDLLITGPYERRQVRKLISHHHLDCIVLPSLWPETYCYALSDAWSAGVPVVSFDIGATAERLGRFGGGIILPEGTAWPSIPDRILEHVRSGDFLPEIIDLKAGSTPEAAVETVAA